MEGTPSEPEYLKALRYCVRLLAMRPYSRQQLKQKLAQRQLQPEMITRVLSYLDEHKLVSDADFAESWVRNRQQFNPKASWLVAKELREKGIEQSEIDQATRQHVQSDEEVARAMAQKLINRYRSLAPEVAERRIYAALARRGFALDTIRRILRG